MDLSRTEIKTIKKAGVIAAIIFSAIATLHLLKGRNGLAAALYILAAVFFVMTRFFPAAFKKVTGVIGWFNTAFLMSITYYLIITPFSLVMKLFGNDPLGKGIERRKETYWIKKEPSPDDIKRYEKQF